VISYVVYIKKNTVTKEIHGQSTHSGYQTHVQVIWIKTTCCDFS